MEDKTIEKIQRALIKRALGYDTSETVEEYALNGDDMTVVRKKVTTKNMPPDITAAKILLEKAGEENKNGYFEMTDEQLEKEKNRLLALLKEKDRSENSKKQR